MFSDPNNAIICPDTGKKLFSHVTASSGFFVGYLFWKYENFIYHCNIKVLSNFHAKIYYISWFICLIIVLFTIIVLLLEELFLI